MGVSPREYVIPNHKSALLCTRNSFSLAFSVCINQPEAREEEGVQEVG